MRSRVLFAAVALAACYDEPTSAPACSVTCETSCPGDLTCVRGYCVAAGQTCEPTFRATSAGTGFACALDTQDVLWCWGANTDHQLDPGDVDVVLRAKPVGDRRWDSISAGGGHICGLRDNRLYCWGRNDRGQVSDVVAGDALEPFEIAAPVAGAKWSFVVAGYNDTCAIADGSLYCWGAGDNGQLGTGTTDDIGTPTPVMTTLNDWTFVDSNVGRYYRGGSTAEPIAHTCAISASAGLHCWGANEYGALGNGTLTDSLVPIAVVLPSPPTTVAVGMWVTCVTTESQQLYCWGYGNDDGLGDPLVIKPQLAGSSYTTRPVLGSDLTGFTKVDASEWYACGQRGDEVYCWGWTYAAGLGIGLFVGQGFGMVASGARDVAVGWNANIDESGVDTYDLDLACIVVDGGVQCWGDNRYGQLGQGGATMQPEPAEVTGDHRFTTIAAGGSHVCGIENGNLLCWGSTTYGQANGIVAGTKAVPCGSVPDLACNVPAPAQLALAPIADEVSLGRRHGCARTGTSVKCWGDNAYTQLGAAGSGPVTLPGAFDGLLDVGTNAQCAKRGTETWCWGTVLGDATPAQRVSSLEALASLRISGALEQSYPTYYSFGCGLDATNRLYCFGDNQLGQYGNSYAVGGSCGNARCDNGETSSSCSIDCGTGPLASLGRTYSTLSVSWPTLYSYSSYAYNITPFTCGVRPDAQIECWGWNYRGALGPQDVSYTPAIIEDLAGCTAVSASALHACGLCGGEIYCWGDHRFGTVGAGAITDVKITTPRKVDIAVDEPFVQIVSGYSFSCARAQSGRTYCWGFSRDGALGSGGASSPLPVTVQLAP